jgi:hypothetical protein
MKSKLIESLGRVIVEMVTRLTRMLVNKLYYCVLISDEIVPLGIQDQFVNKVTAHAQRLHLDEELVVGVG